MSDREEVNSGPPASESGRVHAFGTKVPRGFGKVGVTLKPLYAEYLDTVGNLRRHYQSGSKQALECQKCKFEATKSKTRQFLASSR